MFFAKKITKKTLNLLSTERQNKLRSLHEIAERKKDVEKLKLLQKEVKEKRQLLQNAINGDFQITKAIFKNDTELQRTYQNKKAFVGFSGEFLVELLKLFAVLAGNCRRY